MRAAVDREQGVGRQDLAERRRTPRAAPNPPRAAKASASRLRRTRRARRRARPDGPAARRTPLRGSAATGPARRSPAACMPWSCGRGGSSTVTSGRHGIQPARPHLDRVVAGEEDEVGRLHERQQNAVGERRQAGRAEAHRVGLVEEALGLVGGDRRARRAGPRWCAGPRPPRRDSLEALRRCSGPLGSGQPLPRRAVTPGAAAVGACGGMDRDEKTLRRDRQRPSPRHRRRGRDAPARTDRRARRRAPGARPLPRPPPRSRSDAFTTGRSRAAWSTIWCV